MHFPEDYEAGFDRRSINLQLSLYRETLNRQHNGTLLSFSECTGNQTENQAY